MKKIILSFLLIVSCICIVACGNNNATSNESKKEETQSSDLNTKTIKFGMVSSESHSTYKATEKFKEYVEEKSNGSLKVELYPNSILGGDVQLTEAVALGTVEMALPVTTVMTMYDPEFGVLDLPYMFKDASKAFEALDGDVGERFNEKLEKVGIKVVGYGFNGVRNMTNNIRPITKPEDLSGVKMRVMESPVFIDMFSYLGSNPTPMSFGELYTALQQKTVDGQENPASLIFESKLNEVQDYLSETKHVNNFIIYIINLDFYNNLSEEEKNIIDEATKEFLSEWQINTEIAENQMYIDKISESGTEVNVLTDEELQVFIDKLQPMYEKYRKEYGDEIFEMLEPYRD